MAHAHCPYVFSQAIDPSAEKNAIKVSPQIKKGISTMATRTTNNKTKRIYSLFSYEINIKVKIGIDLLFFDNWSSIYYHLVMSKPAPQQINPDDVPQLAAELVKKVHFPMLATIDGNQPRVRPVSPVRTDGFTVYVANLKSYGKTTELEKNSNVELCYIDEDHNQVRITGVVTIVTDRNLLQDIWNTNRLLQHYLGSIDNPELIVYKITPNKVRFMLEWALKYFEVPVV